ncbi:MAG: ribosome small subunit-dependent GTPase A [Candidatus Marinimicrobia bacterium]|nr:ribosome small subunit-dependent GTPase A [Candidatus Neomarinimicrobiota bacterium]
MLLNSLGFNNFYFNYLNENKISQQLIGRIIRESKKNYIVKTNTENISAQISGNLRYSAKKRSDFPAVGDWVVLKNKHTDSPIIKTILPRKSIIERQAIGKFGKKQTIATNVDIAFIMQDINHDFNLNRLDRFLAICYSSKVEPIIILTKIDLMESSKLGFHMKQIQSRFNDVITLKLSNKSLEGFKQIRENIKCGKTYCFIGASGAGKSSLINNLIGEKVMLTKSLREKNNKGKHTTSHRELFILKNSGILIDTPGMRELGIVESYNSLESTFQRIFNIAQDCQFSNCQHINEPKCSVKNAIEIGNLEQSNLDNYHKMYQEQEQFNSSRKGFKDKKIKPSTTHNKKSR